MPLEVRAPTNHEKAAPFATHMILGWTINGPVGSEEASRTASTAMTCGVNNLAFGLQIERFWKLDSASIQEASGNEKGHPAEDQRALKIMEEFIIKEDGHYSIAVPFRQDVKSLLNNRVQAERRLACLAKKPERSSPQRGIHRWGEIINRETICRESSRWHTSGEGCRMVHSTSPCCQ